MDWSTWFLAIFAEPECPAVRCGFLDWLHDLDPARYGPPSAWWAEFSAPGGVWAVEEISSPHAMVLLWVRQHMTVGIAVAESCWLILCDACEKNGPAGGRRTRVNGRWECDRCFARREGHERPGGLYGAGSGDYGGPVVGRRYDDIPF